MPDLDILHQLIRDAAKVSLSDNYGKCKVELKEPQHSDSSVSISGLPDNAVVIKADAFKSPDTVFNGSKGECKRADFVIVADAGNKKVILYIEMKATKGSKKEIIQQLGGAQCFVAYCQKVGKVFWSHGTFLDGYSHRFVSIGRTSISKKKTRIDSETGLHDRPDRMLKITSPHHLQFRHLAGGNL